VVTDPIMLPTLVALLIAGVVAIAESLHVRRIGRVAHLAFGVGGTPRAWTRAVPVIRTVAAGLSGFGLTVLTMQEPEAIETQPTAAGSKHLLVCFDASPSMYVRTTGSC